MNEQDVLTLGWREWVRLPDLNLPPVKAKIDTGARTSALHAFEVRPFKQEGIQFVEFYIHPRQGDIQTVAKCTASVIDQRNVTDSGGHTEERWVIQSQLAIGTYSWPIELTLTSRDNMRFRMLLGRTALNGRALVNPSMSYLVGKKPARKNTI